jgi:hypothetical protein
MNAANMGLMWRNKRTRHVPKNFIGCWLAFCTLHIPSISPRTILYFLMSEKLSGVSRDTAAPVSYKALMEGLCEMLDGFLR